MKHDNEEAVSGALLGIFVFVAIIVSVTGYIMMSNAFDNHYKKAIENPTNPLGISINNSSSYNDVKIMTDAANQNLPVAILFGFLLAVIMIILLIMAALKLGN